MKGLEFLKPQWAGKEDDESQVGIPLGPTSDTNKGKLAKHHKLQADASSSTLQPNQTFYSLFLFFQTGC